MSYAIIRNSKYTTANLNGIYRHNERKNTNYSNKDIVKENGKNNYSLKDCKMPYSKAFRIIKEKNNLQGWIKRTSNVACEYIITSDKEFFDKIGEDETKRYFKTAYNFVNNFKNLGEEYILSAKVHMDESTPHLHLVFIPVIHKLDKKSGKQTDKISCSEFWKGQNSYKILQDNFYSYMTKSGFNLERGIANKNEHIQTEKLKQITNYEVNKFKNISEELEKEVETEDIEEMKKDYKRVIKRFNTIAKQYTKIKTIADIIFEKYNDVKKENEELKEENNDLKNENTNLKSQLEKTFEYVSILFDFPIKRLRRLVKDFIEKIKE